jgi:hypothetical protein
VLLAFAPPAQALFQNGGFQTGDFTGWTIEHGLNSGGLLDNNHVRLNTSLAWDDNTAIPFFESVSWSPGSWDNTGNLDSNYSPPSGRTFLTSGIGFDNIAGLVSSFGLAEVKYGLHSARVNSRDGSRHATRISQEDVVTAGDRDTDGKFHVRFAWAAVLENPQHDPGGQPYFHITLTDMTDNTVLYSKFNFSAQVNAGWQDVPGTGSSWQWIDWKEVDLVLPDSVLGHTLRIELAAGDCAYGGHGGYAFLDGFRSQASPAEGDSSGTLGALGAGCGRVIDVGGKDGSGSGPWSGVALVTFFFALFLLPVGILKRIHGGKRVSSPLPT